MYRNLSETKNNLSKFIEIIKKWSKISQNLSKRRIIYHNLSQNEPKLSKCIEINQKKEWIEIYDNESKLTHFSKSINRPTTITHQLLLGYFWIHLNWSQTFNRVNIQGVDAHACLLIFLCLSKHVRMLYRANWTSNDYLTCEMIANLTKNDPEPKSFQKRFVITSSILIAAPQFYGFYWMEFN